jgi:hypothetical protein
MKAPWDLPLVRQVMQQKTTARLWRPISPFHNRVLAATVLRHGIERDVGAGHRIRVCPENRRLKPNLQYECEIP